MAEQVQEVVTALTIETGKSYASIAELREAVRGLREQLKQTAFEDENFNKVQKELAATQEALTQVTKMSTAAQAENWEGVDLGTKSYNELTKQMKALNAEWRATTDEVQRQQLGQQILAINNRLKELDASTGNFQRNVGDYANQMKAGMEAFTTAAGNAIPGLNNLKMVADGFAKNPMIAALGLIVNLFGNIITRMKETKEGQQSINKVLDLLHKLLQPLRDMIDDITDAVTNLFSTAGDDLDDVTEGVADLGVQVRAFFSAVWQPVATAIEMGFKRAMVYIRSLGQMLRGNFKAANNLATELAKVEAETIIRRAKAFEFQENYDKAIERIMNRRAERARRHAKDRKTQETELAQIAVDVEAIFAKVDQERAQRWEDLKDDNPWMQAKKNYEEMQAIIPELTEMERESIDEDDRYLEKMVERAETRKKTMAAFVTATASLFGDLATAIEADQATAEKHAGMIKALRAAETIINTISGAMGAFMGITKDTGGWGIALAAVQAASIMATGYANVRKILATDTGSGSTASGISAATPTTQAFVAPQVDYSPQTVSNATGAQEIERLNAGRGDQRVYVVYSDIANAGKQVEVTQAESSFK